LNELNVKELRQMCESRSLKTKGTKQQLIDRLVEAAATAVND
jgi:hypothetical protein